MGIFPRHHQIIPEAHLKKDYTIHATPAAGRDFKHVHELAPLDRMQAGLANRPEVLRQRREAVEHPFGTIKQWMNQGAFLMRGLEKVRGEFSFDGARLRCQAGAQYVGFNELMAAVQG